MLEALQLSVSQVFIYQIRDYLHEVFSEVPSIENSVPFLCTLGSAGDHWAVEFVDRLWGKESPLCR